MGKPVLALGAPHRRQSYRPCGMWPTERLRLAGNFMPAGIAKPDIWGESFVEAWHTPDLAQFVRHWGVAGDVRSWNRYHVPNIGTLAILVTNGWGGLPVA